jgi:hypothetical protein
MPARPRGAPKSETRRVMSATGFLLWKEHARPEERLIERDEHQGGSSWDAVPAER